MNDLININYDGSDRPTVMGRELHEALEIQTPYKKWFDRMCEYGFTENLDFVTMDKNVRRADGTEMPQTQFNHQLTLDMAKEICMIQRSEKGKQCRQYFIEVEKRYNSRQLPQMSQMEMIAGIANGCVELEKRQSALEQRLDSIGEVIALDVNSWCRDSKQLISKIATKMGGFDYLKDVNTEIYRLVEERAGVSLSTRLTNKRNRMAGEGVCKSKRDKLTKVDIIADDKKLIEIYIAIVKKMAVKNGIC